MAPTDTSSVLFLVSQGLAGICTFLPGISGSVEPPSFAGKALPANGMLSIDLLWNRTARKRLALGAEGIENAILFLLC